MSQDAQSAPYGQPFEALLKTQRQLSAALDRALRCLRDDSTGRTARHLVDLSVILRKHKQLIVRVSGDMPSDDLALRYLQLIKQLRQAVSTHMTLMAQGVDQPLLTPAFEALHQQALSSAVLWLDKLQHHPSPLTQPLDSTDQWEHTHSPTDGEIAANATPAADAHDFEIDQILYCSLACQPLNEEKLDALAQSAERLNRIDHITGMLMYGDGVFVQLFEGPPKAVGHLWARLLRDQRHYGVVQLYHRREVEARSCEGWGMQYVEREMLQALVHEARSEIIAGRKTAWAPAIERMDFLLSETDWGEMASRLASAART